MNTTAEYFVLSIRIVVFSLNSVKLIILTLFKVIWLQYKVIES